MPPCCPRLIFLFALSCAAVASFVQPAAADENESLAAEVKQIFRTRCAECHGRARKEAGLDLLDMSSFVGEDKVVVPGNSSESVLFDYVSSDDEDSRMPEAPLPPLEPFELTTIRKWIDAGAPAFPEDVSSVDEAKPDTSLLGTEYILKKILAHVRETERRDRRFYRYFSSNHLLATGATAQELEVQRQALAKAINHLTWERQLVRPIPIDGDTATVFAVDIRKLGWLATPFRVVTDGTVGEESKVNLYDQVLLEYPYAVALEGSVVFDDLVHEYMEPVGLVRPIPFVRMDWFSSRATQTPLYEDLLQLPRNLAELEDELGVDTAKNQDSEIAKRAGMTVSGVSRNNRVVERHPARYGAYWKSFDFSTSRGLQNMFVDPLDFDFAGGEMIWNLPNGAQGYLVTDTIGNRIDEAPTSIVTDKFAEDKVVRNGLACMRCHDRGMKRFADNIRPAFEKIPSGSHSKRVEILKLYAKQTEMDELVKQDEDRFLEAMEKALGVPQDKEPLIPVSRTFLDAPLTLSQAAGELGLADSTALQQIFRLPEFARLGLGGLSVGGVIRRDTWEDYAQKVTDKLGLGVGIAAVDGLTRPDHLSGTLAPALQIRTNKKGNTFAPGDEMVITVANRTGDNLFVELIGIDSLGKMAALTGVTTLNDGQHLRFPEAGAIKIRPQLGVEFITVFASPQKFNEGVLLRGERVSDRIVHDFYEYTDNRMTRVPTELIRKTLKIETR